MHQIGPCWSLVSSSSRKRGGRLAALVWPPRVLRGEQARVWSRATLLELGAGVGARARDDPHPQPPMARCVAFCATRLPMTVSAEGVGGAHHAAGADPHPCTESSAWVLLVQGPPDMISARSHGLPAIAVLGDDAWEPSGRSCWPAGYVSVVLDCDRRGARRLMERSWAILRRAAGMATT